MNTMKLWNELKRIYSELFMKEWEWRTLTTDLQKTSPPFSMMNSESLQSANPAGPQSIEGLVGHGYGFLDSEDLCGPDDHAFDRGAKDNLTGDGVEGHLVVWFVLIVVGIVTGKQIGRAHV